MAWSKTPEDRQRDAQVYGDPEYHRNRAVARDRAGGRCERCGHPHRTQCDHITPVTQGGSHHPSNLQMLCTGPGTCRCHERKTATEGGGYRNPKPADPDPRPGTRW